MSSVRSRLTAQIRAGLLALPGVACMGLDADEVLLPEQVSGEGPVLARGDAIAAAQVQRAVAAGSYGLEVVFAEESAEGSNAFEAFNLYATVVVHLPEADAGVASEDQAAEFCALIHGLYGTDFADGGGDPQWADADGPLAIDTRCEVFCAGVARDDAMATRITVHSFVVSYRFARGNPGVAR